MDFGWGLAVDGRYVVHTHCCHPQIRESGVPGIVVKVMRVLGPNRGEAQYGGGDGCGVDCRCVEMLMPLLASKLHMPALRPELVQRPRLLAHLDAGFDRKLALSSAPASFGTTVVGAWVTQTTHRRAWLSLDESNNDPVRFLRYLLATLQTIVGELGQIVSDVLQSGQSLLSV